MKLTTKILALGVILALMTGVSTSFATEKSPLTGKKVALLLLTREHLFHIVMEDKYKEIAEKYGFELITYDGELDLHKQLSQIENVVTMEVDAIVLDPVASRGLGPGVRLANKKNIPVVVMNIAVHEGEVISNVISGNFSGGVKAGKYIAEMLGGKGNVVIISFDEIVECLDRVEGFLVALKDYPNIKILDRQDYYGSQEKALHVMENMLTTFRDIDVVYTVGTPASEGALAAIKAAGRTNIPIVGFDGLPHVKDIICQVPGDGEIWVADVETPPDLLCVWSFKALEEYLQGESVPAYMEVPSRIVDREVLLEEGWCTK